VKVMDEIGIDISSFKPKGLTSAMNNVFDIIVTMGCSGSCPLTPREKTIAWDIEDPKGKSLEIYRNVRDIIKSHVETLINDIVKGEQ
jgi:protein-tyrosine-phosphatase